MKKFLLLSSFAILLASCSYPVKGNHTSVLIDKVEDGIVKIEVSCNEETYITEVSETEFNSPVKDNQTLPFTEVRGRFHNIMENINYYGEKVTHYQFKAFDDSVWWLLTENEIGEIPDFESAYVLRFFDNGTTAENKTCDCLPEWECECELYDDIFLGITRID